MHISPDRGWMFDRYYERATFDNFEVYEGKSGNRVLLITWALALGFNGEWYVVGKTA